MSVQFTQYEWFQFNSYMVGHWMTLIDNAVLKFTLSLTVFQCPQLVRCCPTQFVCLRPFAEFSISPELF
jgi:hypothetical protein